MYCKNCGQKIEESSKFCNHCGKEVTKVKKEEHSIWNSQEEKDLYYKKRKKNMKYIVLAVVLFIIAFIVSIVAFVFFVLEMTTKQLEGTWSCNQGQEIWEISRDKFKISEPKSTQKKEIKGTYTIYSYNSSYDNGHSIESWKLRLEITDKTESGIHNKVDQTKKIKVIKNKSNVIHVINSDSSYGYACTKKK